MALTKVSGSIIKDSVSLSGNVSVGGTLTYQDVTNVDALGIGTFRTGIKVLAGQVDIGSNIKLGNAGVVTATSFVGSGANLTGVTALSGSTNNTLVTVTGANAIQGESNLTYDGTNLQLTTDANNEGIKIDGGVTYPVFEMTANRGAGNTLGKLISKWNGTEVASIQFVSGSDGTNKDDGYLYFNTRPSGGSMQERLRIDSSGNIGAGGITAPLWTTGGGIHLNDDYGIGFGNGGSGRPDFQIVTTAGARLDFRCGFGADTADIAMTTTGQLLIGTTTGTEILCITRNDATGPTITLENNANKTYINNWGATGGGSGRTNRFEINATLASQASICAPYITFMIGNAGDSYEKLRIDSSGHLLPGTDNALDLGSSSKRWRNIYTGDIQLSNVTSPTDQNGESQNVAGNDVDGTQGTWTIQEGANDLFIINRVNGKKYKFNLTEVS